MHCMTRLLAVLAMFLASFASSAMETNTAAGLAIKGYDPVAYFRVGVPTPGRDEFTAQHQGATYRFSSAAHRDAFLATPQQFLPQYGGYCAFGTARGYKAEVDPKAFSLVDGRLYLNYNEQVKVEWQKDVPGMIRRADERWPEVRGQAKIVK